MPDRGPGQCVERTLRAVLHMLMDVKPHTWRVAEWFRHLRRGRFVWPWGLTAAHAERADELCAQAIRQIRDLLEWGEPTQPPPAGQLKLLVPDPGEQLTSPRWKKRAA